MQRFIKPGLTPQGYLRCQCGAEWNQSPMGLEPLDAKASAAAEAKGF